MGLQWDERKILMNLVMKQKNLEEQDKSRENQSEGSIRTSNCCYTFVFSRSISLSEHWLCIQKGERAWLSIPCTHWSRHCASDAALNRCCDTSTEFQLRQLEAPRLHNPADQLRLNALQSGTRRNPSCELHCL